MDKIIEILTLLTVLAPILINIFKLLGQLLNSKKLENLSAQATVIVSALEQSNLTNEAKRAQAMRKLSEYAVLNGIDVSMEDIDDYIHSAVKFLKILQENNTTTAIEMKVPKP